MSGLEKSAAEVIKKIKAAGTVAAAAYTEFSNSKTIPKSATTYWKSIVTGLDDFEKKNARNPVTLRVSDERRVR